MNTQSSYATKTDGTLWAWGNNSDRGELGQNNRTHYSSPVQIPGTNWALIDARYRGAMATKTDGTLWMWGQNASGECAQNDAGPGYSSPAQVPGTTWGTSEKDHIAGGMSSAIAIKTDGTLWAWGKNGDGELGQNNEVYRSSPVQIPGTEWDQVTAFGVATFAAIQRDNTP